MRPVFPLLGLGILLIGTLVSTAPPALPGYPEARAAWTSSEARLLDRHGAVLDVVRADPQVRRLDWVPLGAVAAPLKAGLVRAEDRRFWSHGGIDWRAIGGALRDRAAGDGGRGASTISMQLAALLAPEALGTAGRRSWRQKLMQLRAAGALEARWTKPQILEAWLNLLPLRGDLVGIDAAARALAGKAPAGLDAAESAVIAALPPSPGANVDAVTRRACAAARGDCAAIAIAAQRLLGARAALPDPGVAPHLAARLLGPETRSVTTTLDAATQRMVRDALAQRLAALTARNVRDAAALVVDNRTGEILAWVGAAGTGSTSGAVDGVRAARQAGSTLKPFLYGLAIERRLLTAASVLDDAPIDLDTASGLYIPQNYDRGFRGRVSVRTALGNSLNVPAVRTLLLTGVEPFRDRLFDSGYTGIARDGDYYGFSLALGSAEVTLLEQAAAYRALANGGRWSPLRVTPGPVPAGRRVLDARAAAIVTDILADAQAREATFGTGNGLALPFPAAVKTGTSKALRDNWCIGYSPRFTVAVWVGNFEGDSMAGVSGAAGAAPAWRDIMLALHRGLPVERFAAAPGVTTAAVRFRPAIEPPRAERFLAGTELAEVRVSGPREARPRIAAPADGTLVALDPDIPPARQRVALRVAGAAAGARLEIGGRPAGDWWLPVPGDHRIVLRGADGAELDRARVTVR